MRGRVTPRVSARERQMFRGSATTIFSPSSNFDDERLIYFRDTGATTAMERGFKREERAVTGGPERSHPLDTHVGYGNFFAAALTSTATAGTAGRLITVSPSLWRAQTRTEACS